MTDKTENIEHTTQLRQSADRGARLEMIRSEVEMIIEGLENGIAETFRMIDPEMPNYERALVRCNVYSHALEDIKRVMIGRIELGKKAQSELKILN